MLLPLLRTYHATSYICSAHAHYSSINISVLHVFAETSTATECGLVCVRRRLCIVSINWALTIMYSALYLRAKLKFHFNEKHSAKQYSQQRDKRFTANTSDAQTRSTADAQNQKLTKDAANWAWPLPPSRK